MAKKVKLTITLPGDLSTRLDEHMKRLHPYSKQWSEFRRDFQLTAIAEKLDREEAKKGE